MSFNPLRNNLYGFPSPLSSAPQAPIVSLRTPNTNDYAAIGSLWIYTTGNAAYILTSIVSNVATWQLIEASGGAGAFTTLVSTGQFNLDTTAVGANTLGNTTGATSITSLVGTGGYTVDGVGASVYAIGASTTTGTITIGGTAQSGNIVIGNSTAAQSLILGAAAGAGASTVSIAAGTPGNTVLINNGTNTGANVTTINGGASAANSTVNILTGNGTAGVQTFNAVTGTRAGVVNIGTGAAAHSVTIGSTTAGAATSIRASSTGGLSLNAAGNLTAPPAVVSAAAYAATLNAQFGQVTLTGQVLASAGVQVLTITNALCTTSTPILLTVDNLGSNDAQLTVQRIQLQAGSFLVTVKNNGAAALNGDIHVTFWLLQ